jgi:hypothetical protein
MTTSLNGNLKFASHQISVAVKICIVMRKHITAVGKQSIKKLKEIICIRHLAEHHFGNRRITSKIIIVSKIIRGP